MLTMILYWMWFWLFLAELNLIIATTTLTDRVLLVLKCETRQSDSFIDEFQDIWKISSLNLQAAGIPLLNACQGENWEELGYLTKPIMYRRALRLLLQLYDQSSRDTPVYDESPLHVLLVDSDTFWSITETDQIWGAYDAIRGRNRLVVSSESTCWIGHFCDDNEVKRWYGNDNPNRIGSMSSFVNSGVVMGQIGEVLQMLDHVIEHNRSYVIKNRGFDDQFAITDYVRSIAPEKVSIDYHQQLAGSCVYPIPINPPEQGRFACRTNTFEMNYNCLCLGPTVLDLDYFRLNQTSCQIHRHFEVWEEFGVFEWLFAGLAPSPLIWHAHGKTISWTRLTRHSHSCRYTIGLGPGKEICLELGRRVRDCWLAKSSAGT